MREREWFEGERMAKVERKVEGERMVDAGRMAKVERKVDSSLNNHGEMEKEFIMLCGKGRVRTQDLRIPSGALLPLRYTPVVKERIRPN